MLNHIYREIKDYFKFIQTPLGQRRLVFYSEDIASYSYFEGLIEQLTQEENLQVCYVTSDPSDPIFKSDNENLSTFYIKHTLSSLFRRIDPEILIMTVPDLNQLYVKRTKHNTNHIYIFHNIGSSFHVLRYGALFHYDTIFCVGNHHIEEIRKQEEIYNLPEKRLIEYGYYRLEKTYNDYKNRKIEKLNSYYSNKRNVRVLIAPTWGKNSILNYCGNELITVLLDSGYTVILRPHPMTLIHNKKLMDSINSDYNLCSNYIYEGDISSTDSFYESDILISDWSGVAYEYAFGTERPVLFVDIPQKIVNERYQDLKIPPVDVGLREEIGEVLPVAELNRAAEFIDRLITNKDFFIEKVKKARNNTVYNFGRSSKVGAAYIVEYLKNCEEKKTGRNS